MEAILLLIHKELMIIQQIFIFIWQWPKQGDTLESSILWTDHRHEPFLPDFSDKGLWKLIY